MATARLATWEATFDMFLNSSQNVVLDAIVSQVLETSSV